MSAAAPRRWGRRRATRYARTARRAAYPRTAQGAAEQRPGLHTCGASREPVPQGPARPSECPVRRGPLAGQHAAAAVQRDLPCMSARHSALHSARRTPQCPAAHNACNAQQCPRAAVNQRIARRPALLWAGGLAGGAGDGEACEMVQQRRVNSPSPTGQLHGHRHSHGIAYPRGNNFEFAVQNFKFFEYF